MARTCGRQWHGCNQGGFRPPEHVHACHARLRASQVGSLRVLVGTGRDVHPCDTYVLLLLHYAVVQTDEFLF